MQTALSILMYALIIGLLLVGLGGISVLIGITLAKAGGSDEHHH